MKKLTVKEASKRIGIHVTTLARWIQLGHVKSDFENGIRVLTIEEVVRVRKAREEHGNNWHLVELIKLAAAKTEVKPAESNNHRGILLIEKPALSLRTQVSKKLMEISKEAMSFDRSLAFQISDLAFSAMP